MGLRRKGPEKFYKKVNFILRPGADYAKEHGVRTWLCLKSVEANLFEGGLKQPEEVCLIL